MNLGKRLEAKVTALRSKFHLTSDIFKEICFIKSFQYCYKTLHYEKISPKVKLLALKNRTEVLQVVKWDLIYDMKKRRLIT